MPDAAGGQEYGQGGYQGQSERGGGAVAPVHGLGLVDARGCVAIFLA